MTAVPVAAVLGDEAGVRAAAAQQREQPHAVRRELAAVVDLCARAGEGDGLVESLAAGVTLDAACRDRLARGDKMGHTIDDVYI